MEELNELLDRLGIIYSNLASLEVNGLYDSEDYNLFIDNLLETFESEREVFKKLKNNFSQLTTFNDILAELRFANTKKFIEQFPQNTLATDSVDLDIFKNLENRKKALKNVVVCDQRMMWFKYMRKSIDEEKNDEFKKKLIYSFYAQVSIFPWSGREIAQQKFVFNDDYILKSYFYGDMLGLGKKDVVDVIDSVCLSQFVQGCFKVIDAAKNENKAINNQVIIDQYLASIKASVGLMSEDCQARAIQILYFEIFNYCGKSKEFKEMAEIAYDRDNLKQDYKVMTLKSVRNNLKG